MSASSPCIAIAGWSTSNTHHTTPHTPRHGKAENLLVRHPDCEHDFPDSERLESYEWIARGLQWTMTQARLPAKDSAVQTR